VDHNSDIPILLEAGQRLIRYTEAKEEALKSAKNKKVLKRFSSSAAL